MSHFSIEKTITISGGGLKRAWQPVNRFLHEGEGTTYIKLQCGVSDSKRHMFIKYVGFPSDEGHMAAASKFAVFLDIVDGLRHDHWLEDATHKATELDPLCPQVTPCVMAAMEEHLPPHGT